MDFGDASRAVKHMNEDHSNSILAYAHYYAKKPNAKEAKLLSATISGFTLLIDSTDTVLIPYPASCSVSTARDLRKVAVYMHKESYDRMGLCYKFRVGYYGDVAKIFLGVVKKKVGVVGGAVGVVLGMGLAGGLGLMGLRRIKAVK
ncbi:hypothetical protein TrRE_jg3821 [Triparma retinervis]|uniref:DUF2470 domain-containing protein n=1 Tax=Triparma retinervis TaxID=2557542 RepID=A0A9W7AHN7_9STRA|nr:hypothetical protein TrRE_jg3821 [Triparma retinervis]